jgi:hypothetical protein
MEYKISEKVLSLPPHISTSWSNILALNMEKGVLVVSMADDSKVRVPGLPKDIQAKIFETHARLVEEGKSGLVDHSPYFTELFHQMPSIYTITGPEGEIPFPEELSGQIGMGGPIDMEGISAAMEHNPEQSDMPDLPPEIVQRISTVATLLGSEGRIDAPEAVQGCNCFHCQIARAIESGVDSAGIGSTISQGEEQVSDQDLSFRSWDVKETGEKLFSVSNPLDDSEYYNVFLGEPLGCTCGHKDCEHIRAVLES